MVIIKTIDKSAIKNDFRIIGKGYRNKTHKRKKLRGSL